VKICILGNSKHKEEIKFISKKLTEEGNFVSTPTVDFENVKDKEKKELEIKKNIIYSKLARWSIVVACR
jgi:hypothetical protein